MTDRIYPQFATHNAHSVAAVLNLADGHDNFEFQRLHGMGEALHDHVHRNHNARCRIYAPVGEHQDLLAYLVRRLLENGANSSFVNQIVDTQYYPGIDRTRSSQRNRRTGVFTKPPYPAAEVISMALQDAIRWVGILPT